MTKMSSAFRASIICGCGILSHSALAAEQPYDVTYCLESNAGNHILVLSPQKVVSNFDLRGKAWANDPAKTKALDGFTLECVGVQHTVPPAPPDVSGYCTWTSPDAGDYFLGKFSISAKDPAGKWETVQAREDLAKWVRRQHSKLVSHTKTQQL